MIEFSTDNNILKILFIKAIKKLNEWFHSFIAFFLRFGADFLEMSSNWKSDLHSPISGRRNSLQLKRKKWKRKWLVTEKNKKKKKGKIENIKKSKKSKKKKKKKKEIKNRKKKSKLVQIMIYW